MCNQQIRIAHVMGKMVSGGVESVVMNYYRNIDKKKIQFDFIVDEDSTYIPRDEIENMGGRVILVPPYQKIFSYIKKLKIVFKENEYKIVHSHLNTISVFPLYAAKIAKVPVRIAHSHSTSNKKEWKKDILKNILKLFSKTNATHYFCCSELAGRWLFGDKEYDNNKVKLINNAIDIDKFIYNEEIRDKIRKEIKVENKLVIGHIGRFVEQKNHIGLLEIFYEIHKENKEAVLLLVGDGPLFNVIKEKVKSFNLQDSVIFLGKRNDVNRLMQGMDIFLLPSLYEGLPVVGVEAQASGLLCIFSDSMTKETKIIESTKFISLSKSYSLWAKEILEAHKRYKRKDTKIEVINSSFEIKTESKKLESIYINEL
nr:glycosyltransferase family 1 protein [uncultured Romboutsia sp.]